MLIGAGSWSPNGLSIENRPLTWYKAQFNLSYEDLDGASLAFDFSNLGKGFAWINANPLGRCAEDTFLVLFLSVSTHTTNNSFWNVTATGNCIGCQYNQSYSPNGGCEVGCGLPTQTYYHVPTEWLKVGSNVLVLFAESGGSIAGIDLVQRE